MPTITSGLWLQWNTTLNVYNSAIYRGILCYRGVLARLMYNQFAIMDAGNNSLILLCTFNFDSSAE